MLERQLLFNRILDKLSWLAKDCELRGLIHLFDTNTISHELFRRLFNELYGLQLQQTDHIRHNFPAIDLGDDVNRQAFQVTTENSGAKVQETIDKYIRHELTETYGQLRIFIIGQKQKSYKAVKVPKEFRFSPTKDILDLKDLLVVIERQETSRLRTIADILDDEIKVVGTDFDKPNRDNTEVNVQLNLLANEVGERIVSSLELATLSLDHQSYVEEFQSGKHWLANIGKFASAYSRKRLCLHMANTAQVDAFLRRIPDWHPDLGLEFFQLATREQCETDDALDALGVSIAFGIGRSRLSDLKECKHETAQANYIRGLLAEEKFEDATVFIDGLSLSGKTAEASALLFAELGELEKIHQVLRILQREAVELGDVGLNRLRRFRVLTSEYLFNRWIAREIKDSCSVLDLNEDVRRILDFLEELLSGILSRVLSDNVIVDGIDSLASQVAFRIAMIKGQRDRSELLAQVMTTATPVPHLIGVAIRRKFVAASREICERLQTDWPNDVNAQIESLSIRTFELQDEQTALLEAEELVRKELSDDSQSSLTPIVLQLAFSNGQLVRDRAYSLLTRLCGSNHHYLRMAEAKWALDEGQSIKAESLLNDRPNPDDPDWLNLRALALKAQGKEAEALADLKAMCQLTTHPDALWDATKLARKLGHRDFVLTTLRRLRRDSFQILRASEFLAHELVSEGRNESLHEAALLFKDLAKALPSHPELLQNAANCLFQLRDYEGALAVLVSLHAQHADYLPAYHLHAYVLEAWKKPDSAFDLLDFADVKKRFWSETSYLTHYIDLGFKTDHELDAHKAMERLVEIEKDVPEAERSLRYGTLEELGELLANRNCIQEDLNGMMIRGQIPWTFAAIQNERSVYAAWSYRTRAVAAHVNVAGRAQLHTYATNGHHPIRSDGQMDLLQLKCPSKASTIVADISALITWNELGILSAVLQYFGSVIVPSAYRIIEQQDLVGLQPTQKSQTEMSKFLDRLLSERKLLVAVTLPVDSKIVACHYESQCNWNLGDFGNWLLKNDVIDQSTFERIDPKEFRPLERSTATESTDPGMVFVVSYNALCCLYQLNCLEDILKSVKGQFFIDSECEQEIRNNQFAHCYQADLLARSEGFWTTLHKSEYVTFSGSNHNAIDDSVHEERLPSALRISIASFDLAKALEIPLIADDRFLISMRLNSESSLLQDAACSTAELLDALSSEGVFSEDEKLRCKLKLVEWRYRNVLLDEHELTRLAKTMIATGSLPKRLKVLATYVQDLTLDIGQFGGNEEVSIPRSLACELYVSWTRNIARFINELWSETEFSDAQCEELTRWVIDCMLPTNGKVIRPDIQVNFAVNQARLVLTHSLIDRVSALDRSRSAKMVRILREHLGMSVSEFWLAVFELCSTQPAKKPFDADQKEWDQAKAALSRSIARHALAQFQTDDGMQIDPRGLALLEISHSLKRKVCPPVVDPRILNAIRDRNNPLVLRNKGLGPLFFHLDPNNTNQACVFPVSDLLVLLDPEARKAALEHFAQVAADSVNSMSVRTAKLVAANRKKIGRKPAKYWYSTAECMFSEIENDWLLNLAGFRQCLNDPNALHEYLIEFWRRCMKPRRHPASTAPESAFSSVTNAEGLEKDLRRIRRSNCATSEKIEEYLSKYAHLPLTGKYSLASLFQGNDILTDDKFQKILELARSGDYLRIFHGCMAFLELWERLNSEQQVDASTAISDFIVLSLPKRSGEYDLDDFRHRFLHCIRLLSLHFMSWLPLFGPEIGTDNSTSVSWWLAYQLTNAIMDDVEQRVDKRKRYEGLVERVINPAVQLSHETNRYVCHDAYTTPYSVLSTLELLGGPFIASFFARLPEHFSEIAQTLEENALDKTTTWILAIGMFRLTGSPDERSVALQSFDTQCDLLLESWLTAIREKSGPEGEMKMRNSLKQIQQSTKFDDLASIEDSIISIEDSGDGERSNWIDRLRVAYWNRRLDRDALFQVLSADSLFEKRIREFNAGQIKDLCDALIKIQVSEMTSARTQDNEPTRPNQSDRWTFELPYLFLRWIDFRNLKDEGRKRLADACICSALIGGVPLAVEQLVCREDKTDFEEVFQYHRNLIESMRGNVPHWTWARVRWLLGQLPGDGK